jgi:hypothetical protein
MNAFLSFPAIVNAVMISMNASDAEVTRLAVMAMYLSGRNAGDLGVSFNLLLHKKLWNRFNPADTKI